jgi:hypothetical protein
MGMTVELVRNEIDNLISSMNIVLSTMLEDCLAKAIFIFCVPYLCLIGRVYEFYVGHVDKSSLYETLFHCNIQIKHHHHHLYEGIYFNLYAYGNMRIHIYIYIHSYIHLYHSYAREFLSHATKTNDLFTAGLIYIYIYAFSVSSLTLLALNNF